MKVSKTVVQSFIFVVLTGVFAFHGFPSWQLFFYGAVGGEVAGSCYYLTNGTDAILIDCGSHFSEEIEIEGKTIKINDDDPFPFDGTKVRAILITHAHADHIGRLHWFILQYPDFTGPIYMTPATWEIYSATLDDTIQYADCFPGCLKTTVKERIKNQKEVVFPLVAFSLVEGVSAYFVENGHIPGSVSVIINIVERNEVTTICFSGDIGPGNHPFLKDIPYDVFSMTQADILVVESTYGDKSRDNVETVEEFYQVIRESVSYYPNFCFRPYTAHPCFASRRHPRWKNSGNDEDRSWGQVLPFDHGKIRGDDELQRLRKDGILYKILYGKTFK